MPLFRCQIRAEYGLADPELYTTADKDDPEALLEGVAMAGLVGILRQLGDLAEFAADIFNGLHEEVMATSSRGHSLMLRVQQLEAEIPDVEKAFLSQASQPPLDLESGIEWHPNPQIEHNLFTQGDMPRFILNSYEECRGPPKLFVLDRFDVAGAGACLKRYSDPSFFKTDFISSGNMEPDHQRERKPRKAKRKGIRTRNDEKLDALVSDANPILPSSSEKASHNIPAKRVKLKKRGSSSLSFVSARSFMESLFESHSVSEDILIENTEVSPFTAETLDPSHQVREVHVVVNTFGNSSQFQEPTRNLNTENVIGEDKNNSRGQKKGGHLTNLSSVPFNEEVLSNATVIKVGKLLDADTPDDTVNNTFSKLEQENLSAEDKSVTDSSVDIYVSDDVASELDNYVDALNTMDSEAETENEGKVKSNGAIINVEPEVSSLEEKTLHQTIHVKSLSSNFCEAPGKESHHEAFPKKKVSRSMDSVCDSINRKLEDHCLDLRNSESRSAGLSNNKMMLSNGDQNNLLGVVKERNLLREETESFNCTVKYGNYNDNAQDKPCSTTDFTDDSTSALEVKSQSSEHISIRANFQQALSDARDPTTASGHSRSPEDVKLDKELGISYTPSEFSKASISSHDMESLPFQAHSEYESNQVPSASFFSNTLLSTVDSLETKLKAGVSLQESLDGIPINDGHASEVPSSCVNHYEVAEKNGDLAHKNSHVNISPAGTSEVSSDSFPRLSLEMLTTELVIDNVPTQREGHTDMKIEAVCSSQISQDSKNGNDFAVSDRYPLPPALVEKDANSSERDEWEDGFVKSEVVCPKPDNKICIEGLSDGFVAESVVDIPSNVDDSICLKSQVSNINGTVSESGNEFNHVGSSRVESLKDQHIKLHQQSSDDAPSSFIQNSSYIKDQTPSQDALHDLYADKVRDESFPVSEHLKLSDFSETLNSYMDDVSPLILPEHVTLDTKVDSEDVTLTFPDSAVDDAALRHGEILRSGASSPKSRVLLDTPKLQFLHEDDESPNYFTDKHQMTDSWDEPNLPVLNHVSQTVPLCPEVSVVDVYDLCNGSRDASDEVTRGILSDSMEVTGERSSSPSNHCFPDVLQEPSTVVVMKQLSDGACTLVTDPVSLKESAAEPTAYSVMNHQEKIEAAASGHHNLDCSTLSAGFASAKIKDLEIDDEAKDKSELIPHFSSDCFDLDTVSNIYNMDNMEQVQGDIKLDGKAEVEPSVLNDDLHPDDLPDGNAKLTAFPSKNHCFDPPSGLEINQGLHNISSKVSSGQCMGSELPVDVAQSLEKWSISDKQTALSDMSPNDGSVDSTDSTSGGLGNQLPDDTAAVSNLTKEQASVSLRSSSWLSERSVQSPDDMHISRSIGSCNNEINKPPEERSSDGVSNTPPATFSGLDPPVNKSILKRASEALTQQEFIGFHFPSQNALQCPEVSLESPPLPPLPPLQWRLGKLQPDHVANENLHPGPDTHPLSPLSESFYGYSLSVAEKTQPVNHFADASTSGNTNSLPLSVSEGTTLLALPSTEGTLPFDDSKHLPYQVAPQGGGSLPVNDLLAMPGLTTSSLHFSSHVEGQYLSFKPSMPVAIPGHKGCSTDILGSNEEVLKASNPFLSTSSGNDVNYQYANSPYAVFGGEGMHILDESTSLPAQGLMPHHFYVHRGDNIYSPYSIPLPPTDMEVPNGRYHSIVHRRRHPLIEAVASHDKSTLRKVSEMAKASAKPNKEGTNSLLEQIRKKSVDLKPAVTVKPHIKGPSTNLQVAAILAKADLIRQACAGSDDEESWSDS